jgi:eukaryotic-like serine/threonine-protein kinase
MDPTIDSPGSGFHYWAFISYSRKDRKEARWLHRAIETYGIPARVIQHGHTTPAGDPPPKRFQPVFRDQSELPASSDLGDALEGALRASRYLIVVCSPHAARSHWVNREIETFIESGRREQVLAYIIDGKPRSGDERECFPPALRLTNPLAADARPQGDGRRDAFLKLVAGMLGVSFDSLRQRDAQRRLQRLVLTISTALLVFFAFAALAWFASQARRSASLAEATSMAEASVRTTAQEAERAQRKIALSRQLASQALGAYKDNAQLALLVTTARCKAWFSARTGQS